MRKITVEVGPDDRNTAEVVEVVVDHRNRLWVNVDGVNALRIGTAQRIFVDDMRSTAPVYTRFDIPEFWQKLKQLKEDTLDADQSRSRMVLVTCDMLIEMIKRIEEGLEARKRAQEPGPEKT